MTILLNIPVSSGKPVMCDCLSLHSTAWHLVYSRLRFMFQLGMRQEFSYVHSTQGPQTSTSPRGTA